MKRTAVLFILILLLVLCGVFVYISLKLLSGNKILTEELEKEREGNRLRESVVQGNFLGTSDTFPDMSGDAYTTAKEHLQKSGENFIDVDLAAMTLTLYAGGKEKEKLPVLAKGREGSWWETPTGKYVTLLKESNHFSSIGKVWMPWSIQFYGNFFIHGWPYHPDGSPVEKTYSGGCIRLATEDAKKVFEFTKRGTPILIYEKKVTKSVSSLTPLRAEIPAPDISAESAMIADLDTGDILLNKNADTPLAIASLTKLMTAVVGSELIYLERGITIRSSMLSDSVQSYSLVLGKEYKAFDLFYPLLMQSSNGASRALASFIGGEEFIRQMNEKAKTLGMANSAFVDPAGIGDENVGTLKDIAKLSKYIADKRNFIFDITKGKRLVIFSEGELSRIENHNEFASDTRLLGMKNGKTSTAGESLASVFLFKTPEGGEHRIFIGLLKSENRRTDAEKLIGWAESSFGLK